MFRRRVVVLCSAAALCVAAGASAKFVSVGDEDVRFLAIGPAGMKINGKASDLKAKESDGKIEIRVPVNDLETGIGLRDKHLKGYLKASAHPEAILVVERSKLKMPEDKKTVTGSAKGKLTLKGVTKPMSFDYKAKRTGSDYHVQGKATIDIRDHEIEVPCYLGVCVDPEVKIKVKFKLRDK